MTEQRRTVLLEGYTLDEILGLPDGDLDALVFVGEPVVFLMGTAELLGQFRRTKSRGEGVLPTLSALARRYAAREALAEVEWIVHAVTCAKPNLKLRRMLERRGFIVTDLAGGGRAYHAVDAVHRSLRTVSPGTTMTPTRWPVRSLGGGILVFIRRCPSP